MELKFVNGVPTIKHGALTQELGGQGRIGIDHGPVTTFFDGSSQIEIGSIGSFEYAHEIPSPTRLGEHRPMTRGEKVAAATAALIGAGALGWLTYEVVVARLALGF